jgi:hypothetical protein
VAIQENPPRLEPYRAMRTITDRLGTELPSTGVNGVEATGTADAFGMGYGFQVGILYWLRRTGRPVVVPPNLAKRLTPAYAQGTYDRVIKVTVDTPPGTDGRLIASTKATDALLQNAVPKRVVRLWLLPERGKYEP